MSGFSTVAAASGNNPTNERTRIRVALPSGSRSRS
jgi:hypothetical protein